MPIGIGICVEVNKSRCLFDAKMRACKRPQMAAGKRPGRRAHLCQNAIKPHHGPRLLQIGAIAAAPAARLLVAPFQVQRPIQKVDVRLSHSPHTLFI